jgi:hypothetical protein
MRLEELGQLENVIDAIGNRDPALPACGMMPQQTTLPRARFYSSVAERQFIATQ